ncbi:hypothetical protein Tco_0863322 [Tanacetum coccineum]
MRIDPTMTQKEETYQVVLDIIKNTFFYKAFLATADVPEILMQQFWHTVTKIKESTFYEYKGELNHLPKMLIDLKHQPWRTLASIINKCLSGKTFSNDRLRQSRVEIIWDDPDVGFKIGKSISKTDAELLMKQGASKKSNRSQSHIGSSSKETGIISGVLGESTVIVSTSSEGTGSKDKSDYSIESDELKGAEKEKIDEEEIEWVSTNEEDEQPDDQDDDDDRSIDIEKTDDEEETNDGRIHGVEYVHDDADKDMKDAEVAKTRKNKEEISDPAKADV